MLTTALTALPAITSTFSSLTTNEKDAERFQRAQQYYQLAVAGDKDAECALKYLTGRYGCNTCGRFGQACGFATDAAKKYCGQLYDQFLQVKSGTLSAQAPIPTAPSGGGTPITVTAQTGVPGGGGVTLQAGAAPPMTEAERQARMVNFLLIGALVVAGMVFFFRKR